MFYKNIKRFEFIKVISWTSIATLIKMLSTFLISKIIAVTLGPTGLSLFGNLWNNVTIFNTISSGGINTGIIKLLAQNNNNLQIIDRIKSSALGITLFFSLITSVIVIVFSSSISNWILNSTEYRYIFVLLGITIFFSAFNNYLISIVNGNKDYISYTKINIVNSLIMLLVIYVASRFGGLRGTLIATASYQIFMFIGTCLVIYFSKERNIYLIFKIKIYRIYSHSLFHFSLITFIPALLLPYIQITLRNFIINYLSLEKAGIWEGLNRLSSSYLIFFTSTLGVYFLPLLAETEDKIKLRSIILKTYLIMIPFIIVSLIFIYLLRIDIINILFTSQFIEIEKLLHWQLIGDFFKIFGWILAILLIAKQQTKSYILTEIIFNILYFIISKYLIVEFLLEGSAIAYMISYIIYFLLLSGIVTNYFLRDENFTCVTNLR